MDYEKALERARAAYGTGAYDDATLEFLFPQLKESEDEKIRKALIDTASLFLFWETYGLTKEQVIAYLEKKKEKVAFTDNGTPRSLADEFAEIKRDDHKAEVTQDYSGLTDLERAIHRGFLCAGVENVPVGIIKETAQDCLNQMKALLNAEGYLREGDQFDSAKSIAELYEHLKKMI